MYIQNRCPHVILKDKTPEEVLLVIKPEVGHLRIFGCPVYIHVPKEKRTKIIKVSFDYVLKIMKHENHGTLKGCSNVFKAERHLSVCESSPRKNKCRLVLVFRFNLNFIMS
jgi:hypothetical protein